MATGQPLRHVYGRPGENAMWDLFFERRPPGDPIVRVLCARIGMLLETYMSSDEKQPPRKPTREEIERYYSWHFWLEKPDDLLGAEDTEESEIAAAWGDSYAMLKGEMEASH